MYVKNEQTSYWVVISLSTLFGVSYAFLQSGLYGAAGPCPALTNSLTVGLGISGLGVNLLRMLLLASTSTMENSLDVSAQIFFYITASFMALCSFLAFRFVKMSESAKKYRDSMDFASPEEKNLLNRAPDSETLKSRSEPSLFEKVKEVYAINWKEALGITITYTVQMAFFPGVILKYQWTFIKSFSWFAITAITLASFADTIGRTIGSYAVVIPKRWFLLASILRGAIFTTLCLLTYEGVYL